MSVRSMYGMVVMIMLISKSMLIWRMHAGYVDKRSSFGEKHT